MLNVSSEQTITMYIGSLGSAISATILALFLLYSLIYYFFTRPDPIVRDFALLQLSMLLFIGGFGAYASGRTAEQVDLWSRISYTGVALAPLAFHRLLETVMERPPSRVLLLLGLAALIMTVLLWASDSWLITTQVLPTGVKGHPSMVKGPGFPAFIAGVLALLTFSYLGFVRYWVRTIAFRRLGWPLLLGFGLWILNGYRDGMVAVGLLQQMPLPWLGPFLMVVMAGMFLGRLMAERSQALERAMHEKELLYQQMIRDELTDVYSRNYLLHILEHELMLLTRHPANHCLLFIDIDDFKQVNDELGHQVGDAVLRKLGTILCKVCRKSDVPARFGGDEFLLLLLHCPEQQGISVAAKIQRHFGAEMERLITDPPGRRPGLSIGISSSRHWNVSLSEVVEQPDFAMYVAKRAGKNGIAIYEGSADGLAKLLPAAGQARAVSPR